MTTTKPPRTCTNCARVRVVGKATLHYVCAVTGQPVDQQDTCECWKKRRSA
jgi:hypothetical protein